MSVSKNRHSLPGFSVTKTLKKFLRRKGIQSRSVAKNRSLLVEALEGRALMAADSLYKHNEIIAGDVNLDYSISSMDALLVVNALSRMGSSASGEGATTTSSSTSDKGIWLDVNNDGTLSAIDALMVINSLSRGEGVGELADVNGVLLDASGNPLPSSNVGGTTVYTVGANTDFFYRLQTADLRTSSLQKLGVAISTVDLAYTTVGSPDAELVLARWSDQIAVNIGQNATGGSFTLAFGANKVTAAIPITTVAGELDSDTVSERIRVEIEKVFGTGSVQFLRVVPPIAQTPTYSFQYRFINSLYRVDVPTPTVNTNNITGTGAGAVTLTTTANDANIVGTNPVNNGRSPNLTFTYSSDLEPGTVRAVPGTGYVLDNVGGSKLTTDNLLPTDNNQYAKIVDVPFRSTTAGIVDFTVGPAGGTAGIVLVQSTDNGALANDKVSFQQKFRLQIVSSLQAVNDTRTTNEDTSIDIPVTSNDIIQAAGGTSFSVTALGALSSSIGTISIVNNNQSVRFQPASNFNGTGASAATFTYTITSNTGVTSTATVTVNVTPVNDAPVSDGTSFSMSEDAAPLTLTPDQLFNAGPANESTQIVTLSNAALVTGQTGGSVAITGGNVVFTPTPDFAGTVAFTVDGTDNGSPALTTKSTVTVTVTPQNDKPIARTVSYTIAEESGLLTMTSAQLFAPGPANESAQTVTIVSATPVAGQTGGTLNFTNSGVTFTPAANFFGQYKYTVVGRDSGSPALDSDPVTVTINVTNVNDAPVAVNDTGTANRFSVVGIPNTAYELDVMRNDNAGPLETTDTITVTAIGALTGVGTLSLKADGTKVIYRTATTNVGFNTVQSFTYTIRDAAGLTSTATAEVFIIPPVLPFAADSSATVAERITTAGTPVTVDVLSSVFENSGTSAILIGFTQPPAAQGSVALNDNGTPANKADDKLVFTPALNFNGNAVFTYTANDTGVNSVASTGTVTVSVVAVNTPPTAQDQSDAGTEDTDLTITSAKLLTGSTKGINEDNQTLVVDQVSVITANAGTARIDTATGNVIYSPAANFNGRALLRYTLKDNGTTNGLADPKTASATITVDIAAVNDAPVPGTQAVRTIAENQVLTIPFNSIFANDTPGPANESSQSLTISAVALASGAVGSVQIQGTNVLYTPPQFFNSVAGGNVAFTYTLQDDGTPVKTATGTVPVRVTEVNQAPVPVNATRNGFASLPLTVSLTSELAAASRGAANESAQTLRITRAFANPSTSGQVSLNADGTIRYVAPSGFSGNDTFSYEVVDNGTTNGVADPKTSIATVTISILPFQPSVVSGNVYLDADNDGLLDSSERRLGGVEVVLTGRSLGSSSDIQPIRHITLADGSYRFEQLPPGTYTVTYVKPLTIVDAPGADSVSRSIVAPGGASIVQNFAGLSVTPAYSTVVDRLLNSYLLQNGQVAQKGLYGLVKASDGSSAWTLHLGGFESSLFNEIVLRADGRSVQLTRVDANRAVFTAEVPAKYVVMTKDSAGNTLVRIVATQQDLVWQNTSTPPITTRGYLDSVERVFAEQSW